MTLDKSQHRVIDERPLGDGLTHVLENFSQESGATKQEALEGLLTLLIDSSASFHLQVSDDRFDIQGELRILRHKFRSGLLSPSQFHSLAESAKNNASEYALWNAALDIIRSLGTGAYHFSVAHTANSSLFTSTPLESSSESLASSAKRETVEEELMEEIRYRTFRNVMGFYDRFFSDQAWSKTQHQMYESLMHKAYSESRWIGFPVSGNITEENVRLWLSSLQEQYLIDAPNTIHTPDQVRHAVNTKGQMHVLFLAPESKATNAPTLEQAESFYVVGELMASQQTGNFKGTLLQLSRYVRNMFANQPLRQFVHAFTLCGSVMENWIFDRSGPFSSGEFDINLSPKTFARVLVTYATMQSKQAGMAMFFEQTAGQDFVTLLDTSEESVKVHLVRNIFKPSAIVCRGTTCYATQNDYVAKFAWTTPAREHEAVHLQRAQRCGVVGVARLVAHRNLASIADIRQGLSFPRPHRFENPRKRKAPSEASSHSASASDTRLSLGENTLRGSNQDSTSGAERWENKMLSCTVVAPVGRVLSNFRSVKELLTGMLDAIKAHRSLHDDAGILHRDISPNNIILVNQGSLDGLHGMLIDLDFAKRLETKDSGAWQLVGTVQYMAIEVLRGQLPTVRHDLESFFYVLLWMCARTAWKNGSVRETCPFSHSCLEMWERNSVQTMALCKQGHMSSNGLSLVLNEFPRSFETVKPLCRSLRTILFGRTSDIVLGPHEDSNVLYGSIIEAFETALRLQAIA